MTSKLDRWKKISAGSKGKGDGESSPNKNKPELIQQLARVPDDDKSSSGSEDQLDPKNKQQIPAPPGPSNEKPEEGTIIIEEVGSDSEKKIKDEVAVGSNSKDSTPNIEVDNKSNIPEYTIGVENKNNTRTDSGETPPPAEPEHEEEDEDDGDPDSSGHKEVTATVQGGNSFVSKISQNIRETIDNKVTKEKTHRKTSVLLRNDTLDKLANYDLAMGGRIQGLFINDLLDSFFEELEQDEKWRKILNRKVVRRR